MLVPSNCFTLFPVDCSLYRTDSDILKSFGFHVPINADPPASIKTYGTMEDTESISLLTITNQKRVPKTVACLKKLKYLTIRNTPIDSLDSLGTSLEELQIYDTPIIDLSAHLGRWTRLRTLILSNTALTKLPESIGDLKGLKILDLSNNRLRSLPVSVRSLTSIKQITLDNNPELQSIQSLNGLATLESLKAEGCSIGQLPLNLPQLTSLYMARNALEDLQGIRTLGAKTTKKKYFQFNNNHLQSIPAEIQDVHNLHTLNVDNNCLFTLSNNLWDIPSLQYLYARNNPLDKWHVKGLLARSTRRHLKLKLYLSRVQREQRCSSLSS